VGRDQVDSVVRADDFEGRVTRSVVVGRLREEDVVFGGMMRVILGRKEISFCE
jgi:hypothetical protein